MSGSSLSSSTYRLQILRRQLKIDAPPDGDGDGDGDCNGDDLFGCLRTHVHNACMRSCQPSSSSSCCATHSLSRKTIGGRRTRHRRRCQNARTRKKAAWPAETVHLSSSRTLHVHAFRIVARMHMHVCVHISFHICMYIYICMCMYVSVYIYIHMYVHISIYRICIHIWMHLCANDACMLHAHVYVRMARRVCNVGGHSALQHSMAKLSSSFSAWPYYPFLTAPLAVASWPGIV